MPATMPAMGPEVHAGRLQVVKVDDKAYAWVPGAKPVAIGEIPVSLYDDLASELRQRAVWHVEPNEVIGLRLQAGAERLELRREGEEWVNALSPDEKADAEKVRAFLAELKDLPAERFVTYSATPRDANELGLSSPWGTLELRLAGGKGLSLRVSSRGPEFTRGRYASGGTVDGIFVLGADIKGRLEKKFADFKKSPPPPPAPPPPSYPPYPPSFRPPE